MNDDTPRTNARVMQMLSSLQSGTEEVVRADFARELERENTKLHRALGDIEKIADREDYYISPAAQEMLRIAHAAI